MKIETQRPFTDDFRIARRLAHEGFYAFCDPRDVDYAQMCIPPVYDTISSGTCFDGTYASEQFHRACNQMGQFSAEFADRLESMCMAPLSPLMWVEHPIKRPSEIFEGEPKTIRQGTAIVSVDLAGMSSDERRIYTILGEDEARWKMSFTFVMEAPGSPIITPSVSATAMVTPQGKMAKSGWHLHSSPSRQKENRDILIDYGGIVRLLGPIIELHALLHCNNIGVRHHEIKGRDEKKFRTRFGPPANTGYRFTTLTFKAPRTRGQPAGEERDLLPGQRAEHGVLGHFANYGAEFGRGLLFGKYSGRFYVPPHQRGNPAYGIIDKTYKPIGGDEAKGAA